MYDIFIIEK